ncbi:glucokinase [Sphingomonas morindae]|uniref:Glucokinase n=1 Tax=Sphingomonas morindae TaxID=1541170 RepID=A0ABY4X3H2_9SPHN|nr:glucokinase [Sphingomonas morindae]USI71416.1 glucokinase [Sphingomonas morindae]
MDQEEKAAAAARVALVADVGRLALRIGLTDAAGRLKTESVRSYDPVSQPTVSGAISSFARDAGLDHLPRRLAVAVSGMPRGDTITVTHGRWRVSRSGLTAMLQAPPLILNDFAANAWAIGERGTMGRLEALAGPAAQPHGPGAFCVIGIGNGLGVALLTRDEHGIANVVPTEAGHSGFPAGLKALDPLIEKLGARLGYATAETILSGPGLVALHACLAQMKGAPTPVAEARETVRLGLSARDPIAVEALGLFVRALWHFAGNMVLALGAWDGVILTGSIPAELRPLLSVPDLGRAFALEGPYKRQLGETPRALVTFPHAALEGAAAALLVEDARRAVGRALAV